ncbi:MAG: methylase N-4/N-6 domain protein [Candidatus Nomurabacteria bacterium GW2011_GWA2_41_25]|uniref:site-specific DNA-methyltransferase (cytosine-N(4)-specific) n=1 Tax=Candidatus Nomurabacteria bacterium GW2011_GWA2_41_25 TaxID=1618736 RepID=A0A0G0VYR7_9BACT|nr:MAG: methylase N-4/N-6 domain protein [Candidatus Nomurabacteria bacterium GW2011_GWA2_41_25]
MTKQLSDYLVNFDLNTVNYNPQGAFLFSEYTLPKTKIENLEFKDKIYPKYINEFWTAKQRQSNAIHEISYRACFKPQLPNFFIELLTKEGDFVYDPFSGRGTTAIEAGILSRNVISNDINPLSKILTKARFFIPDIGQVAKRLLEIDFRHNKRADIDLSMFYHPKTESELVSLRDYLIKKNKKSDFIDDWIKMVATNRLTGHSPGFFSVYTLPPNQAVSQESQRRINKKRNQKPEYRNIKEIILSKTQNLIKDLSGQEIRNLKKTGENGLFLSEDSRKTKKIDDNSVQLVVTSPPFLDIVQYSKDNWLRCWFNNLDAGEIEKNITMAKDITIWSDIMRDVFKELFRVVKKGGWVAFEVGEVRNGKIKLDEEIVPLGIDAGFKCVGIMINEQVFTKTSNIWGVSNNKKGTNSNRIVLLTK